MSQIEDAPEKDSGRGGMDRRTMIKAAAVAGVGAWTAPMIIDSLSSPAAALSTPCSVFAFVINGANDGATTCTATRRGPNLPAAFIGGLDRWHCGTTARHGILR